MLKVNFTWALLLGGSAAVAWLSCSKIDSPVVFWDAVVKLFLFSFLLWIGCTILNKIYSAFAKQSRSQQQEVTEERKQWFETERKRNRLLMQDKTTEKVDSYKERILVPREEARKQKQDQELNLIMGHTFRGSGTQLADDGQDFTQHRENTNEDARERRRLPSNVVQHRTNPEPKPDRKTREIKLLQEPDEGDADSITVTLHTPVDQRKSRRFLISCSLQAVLDYMTTLGFDQAYYTLSSSYPRKPLTDSAEKTLKQLKFDKRTLLYIQKKE